MPSDSVEPVFTGTDNLESLFVECGNEVLLDLHRTLADEPVSLMLTDADGVVLSRMSGDHGLLQASTTCTSHLASPIPNATSAPTGWGWRLPTVHPR